MNVLVTGQPGVGKTTLIMKVFEKLKAAHPDKSCRGFYTEEVRSGGERVGFDVVAVDGRRGPLARTAGLVSPGDAGFGTWRQQPSSQTARGAGVHAASYGGRGKRRDSAGRAEPRAVVGKYAVDVASFETLMLPQLGWNSGQPSPDLVVIDEIGKMELFSKNFWPAVRHVLDSPVPVLGSVPVPRYGRVIPEVELVRKRADVEIITLTRENRERMVETVFSKLHAALSLPSSASASS